MALTRRFFTGLAHEFREARPNVGGDFPELQTSFAVWMHMVTITASALARTSAQFNYAKFYEACGMPQESIDRVASRG